MVSASELPLSDLPPLPEGFARRVAPSALSYWELAFDTSESLPDVDAFAAVVQVDRFASKGGIVQRNHFHESYNNAGRFAASDLLFRENVVETCGDGFHVSYDIAKLNNFLEGSLGMRNISIVNNTFN